MPDFAGVFVMPRWLMLGNAHPSDILSAFLNGLGYHSDKGLLTPEQLLEVQAKELRRKR